MADYLLKRARRLDTCISPNERSKCLCGELADLIEQLEAVLRDVLLWSNHCAACDCDDDWEKIETHAGAALGEKKDG